MKHLTGQENLSCGVNLTKLRKKMNNKIALKLHKKLCDTKDRLKSHQNKKLWLIEELNEMIWLSDQLINHKNKLEDSNGRI